MTLIRLIEIENFRAIRKLRWLPGPGVNCLIGPGDSGKSTILYALRARIECFFNKLKNNRRIATRYDQTSTSFLGFVLLGCIRIWIRFVHAA